MKYKIRVPIKNSPHIKFYRPGKFVFYAEKTKKRTDSKIIIPYKTKNIATL